MGKILFWLSLYWSGFLQVLSSRLGRKPEDIIKLDANENPYGPPPEASHICYCTLFGHLMNKSICSMKFCLSHWFIFSVPDLVIQSAFTSPIIIILFYSPDCNFRWLCRFLKLWARWNFLITILILKAVDCVLHLLRIQALKLNTYSQDVVPMN